MNVILHCPANENKQKAWLEKQHLNNQNINNNNNNISEICPTIFDNPRQTAKYL